MKGRTMSDAPFWRTTPLSEMSREQWESLCDGCAKCCLTKLKDIDSGELVYTDVACHLLDLDNCRCERYDDRRDYVPSCHVLTPETFGDLPWMPSGCAYRLIAGGKDLPLWHPLVSGEPDSVHVAGASVRHRVLSETEVDDIDLEDHVVAWPK